MVPLDPKHKMRRPLTHELVEKVKVYVITCFEDNVAPRTPNPKPPTPNPKPECCVVEFSEVDDIHP